MKAVFTFAATVLASAIVGAADIPARLPNPDGKPGNASKPVKVYILAGQSNMVGMGDLSGAKNVYTGVYFSSDPTVPDQSFQIYKVGNFKTSALTIIDDNGKATKTPIAEGQFQVPQHGVYHFQCGFGESSFCKMQLDGKSVYNRSKGGESVKEQITLKPGTQYRFKISGFKETPPRFWIQKMDLLGNGDLEAVAKRKVSSLGLLMTTATGPCETMCTSRKPDLQRMAKARL